MRNYPLATEKQIDYIAGLCDLVGEDIDEIYGDEIYDDDFNIILTRKKASEIIQDLQRQAFSASDAQIRKIQYLQSELGYEITDPDVERSKQEASELIQELETEMYGG